MQDSSKLWILHAQCIRRKKKRATWRQLTSWSTKSSRMCHRAVWQKITDGSEERGTSTFTATGLIQQVQTKRRRVSIRPNASTLRKSVFHSRRRQFLTSHTPGSKPTLSQSSLKFNVIPFVHLLQPAYSRFLTSFQVGWCNGNVMGL
jgi:hypothetical protein